MADGKNAAWDPVVGRAGLRALVAGAAGALVGLGLAWVDRSLGWSLPSVDVERTSSLLVTLVGAQITIAVFALWMRSIVVGLATTQLSPRIVATHLEDRFQWHLLTAMSAAIGLLVAALLGLDMNGPGAPPLSVITSVVVVIAGLVAVLGSLRIGVMQLAAPRIVRGYAEWALEVVQTTQEPDDVWPGDRPRMPEHPVARLRAVDLGWVGEVDRAAILEAMPPGAHVAVCVDVGSFVQNGETLAVCDENLSEPARDAIRGAIVVQPERSRGDLAHVLQHLRDVAEQALSRAGHDKSTAQESLLYLGAVLRTLLQRREPSGIRVGPDGRLLSTPGRVDAYEHLASIIGPLVVASREDPIGAQQVGALIDGLRELAEGDLQVQQPERLRQVLSDLADDVQDTISRAPLTSVPAVGRRGGRWLDLDRPNG